MKKVLSLTLMALILGSGLTMAEQKIAVVDVQAVVAKSAQVQALKKEQQAKFQDLEKWLNTAQADVEKQKTQDGKDKLLKKYNSEFAKKKEVIAKDYASRLQDVDKSITSGHPAKRYYDGEFSHWSFHDTIDINRTLAILKSLCSPEGIKVNYSKAESFYPSRFYFYCDIK